MYSRWVRVAAAVPAIVFALSLMAGTALGQSSQPAAGRLDPPDPLERWHASLSAAADKAVAMAAADRAWMRAPEVSVAAAAAEGREATIRRERSRAGVERVRQLRPKVEPILRQEGVPAELSAVLLVESGGQNTALSPKGARGVWQFMPDTARRYGLTVSAERDERLDVSKSTRAAARYLRDLHRQFGDWRLAFAAYNAGERAIERAMGRTRQRDFFAIQPALPQETRDYVPAVLSAMAVLGGDPEGVAEAGHPSRRSSGRVLYASAEAKDQ